MRVAASGSGGERPSDPDAGVGPERKGAAAWPPFAEQEVPAAALLVFGSPARGIWPSPAKAAPIRATTGLVAWGRTEVTLPMRTTAGRTSCPRLASHARQPTAAKPGSPRAVRCIGAGLCTLKLTPLTSWAPKLDQAWYRAGGPLWWRIAVVDGGNNTGAFTTGRVTIPKQMVVSAKGVLRRGRSGSIVVTVLDSKRKPVSAAALRSSGAGSKVAKARTGRRGTGTLRIRATKRGTVKIRVIKRGWLDGTLSVKVR